MTTQHEHVWAHDGGAIITTYTPATDLTMLRCTWRCAVNGCHAVDVSTRLLTTALADALHLQNVGGIGFTTPPGPPSETFTGSHP